MISIGSPKLLAIVVSRFSSITRSGEQARRRLPTWCQSTACPVSASSRPYSSTECSSMRVVLRDDRSWPTNPAACHVAPSVSWCCSSSTHVGLAHRGQVIGDAAADDAAADDHDSGRER